MAKVKIGIVGCAGRMGLTLIRQILDSDSATLSGGTERAGSDALGKDVATLAGGDPCGLTVGEDPAALFAASDAVIDFTSPEATVAHAALAAKNGTVHIIGTTGTTAEQDQAIAAAAAKTAIMRAPNMSLGINLLLALTRQLAGSLDDSWDIEINEIHHRHKVDAPSGTALALGRSAAEGRGVNLDDVSDRARDGLTGEREQGRIGFSVMRGGNMVGDHSVYFAADGERIELTHRAGDRSIYARGAVSAALWAQDKPPGLYSMADVLGLND